jgi:hypothetical protein
MSFIRDLAVYLLNREGKQIKVKDIVKHFGKKSKNISGRLKRDFADKGYIRKIAHGIYVLDEPEALREYLNKTQQTQQPPITVPMPKGILTRIHHIKGKIRCYAKDFQGWDIKPINQYAWAARMEIDTGDGFIFTAQYNNTKHEYGTLSLNIQPVTINTNALKPMATRINNAFQDCLIWLNENYGFRFDQHLQYTVKDHYGVSLKAMDTGELPKTFNINNYWFYDNSPGWPELETHQKSALKELAETPARVNALEGKLDSIERNMERMADSMEQISEHITKPQGPQQPIKELDDWDRGAYR